MYWLVRRQQNIIPTSFFKSHADRMTGVNVFWFYAKKQPKQKVSTYVSSVKYPGFCAFAEIQQQIRFTFLTTDSVFLNCGCPRLVTGIGKLV
jgi:hypothetical protein